MKKIAFFFIILFVNIHASFAQQSDCDKCLPSKIYLDGNVALSIKMGDSVVRAKTLDDDNKSEALDAVVKSAFNYIMQEDPTAQCIILTPNRPVEKSSFSVVTSYSDANDKGTLRLALVARCDNKKIANSEVSVDLTGDEESLKEAGEKAVRQLMPLEEKLMTYALTLRQRSDYCMLNGKAANLELSLKDPAVAIGQETEVYVRLTDCDGYPLKNRLVNFKKYSMKGRSVPGVVGGVVTPSNARTDAEGRLKVKFKRTAKSAMIGAYNAGYDPAGCPDLITGVLHIGDMPVKIVLQYKYYHKGAASAAQGGINDYSATEEQTASITCYYFPERPLGETFSLALPLKANQTKAKLVYMDEEGGYECHTAATGAAAPLVFGDINASSLARIRSGSLNNENHTSIKINWTGLEVNNGLDSTPVPTNPRFKKHIYAGSKVDINFAYLPDLVKSLDSEESHDPDSTTDQSDIFVPIPGPADAPKARRQMDNTPVKDLYFDETTQHAFFKKITLSKEEDPSYKKVIRMGIHNDRQAPAHKILGNDVNLLVGDTLLEACLIEVYIPR